MPRREPLRARQLPRAALPALLALLAACGGGDPAVPVAPPAPGAAAAAACARLHAALPGTVDEGKLRRTEPASDLTAAWRDPPVVLRCGVADPKLQPTTQLRNINDVDWYTSDTEMTGPHTYTTIGRVANVELTIPDGRMPAGALVDLAEPVKRTLPAKRK